MDAFGFFDEHPFDNLVADSPAAAGDVRVSLVEIHDVKATLVEEHDVKVSLVVP